VFLPGTDIKMIFDSDRIRRYVLKKGIDIPSDRIRKFFNKGVNFRERDKQLIMEHVRQVLYSKAFIAIGLELKKTDDLRKTTKLFIEEIKKDGQGEL